MKLIALSSVALVALSTAALGADYPGGQYAYPQQAQFLQRPSLFAPAPVFSWTGFYAGLQVGYGFGEDETRLRFAGVPIPLPLSTKFETDGFVGGAHAGFNTQMGMVVTGLEGDVELSGVTGELTLRQAGVPYSASAETDFNWQGSIRGRLGVAVNYLMVYATGGLAYANIDNVYSVNLPSPNLLGIRGGRYSETAAENDHWGWTAGAGVEHVFSGNVTARLEYRYTQFERYENASRHLANGGSASQEPHVHTVRIGASYKY